MNLNQLACELIDIPSTTGDEAAVADLLQERLSELGFIIERQEVSPLRSNLIATLTPQTPRVFLSSHMDTVPPHILSSEDEEFIYGRGACDTKGIIAAQICAAAKLIADGITDIGFLFTVDEEMGSVGAKRANEHKRARECRYLINGEPTDNRLAIGSKGSLRVRLHAEGHAAHSAYPEHGDSAILKLLDVLNDLHARSFPSDEFFGETTLNIGTISGGTRPNVVPAEAHADLQIRLVTDSARVKKVLEQEVAGRAGVEYLSVAEPVRMLEVEGFESCVVRFTTDLSHLTNWGTPLLIGPGSILDAHTAGERIAKAELARGVALYVKLVRKLLAEEEGNPSLPLARKGAEQ